jgi:hypothetical protein
VVVMIVLQVVTMLIEHWGVFKPLGTEVKLI